MVESTKKILVLKNGEKHTVTAQEGKYYICGKTQFRIASPDIQEVIEVKEEEKKSAPKKKTASKKGE